MREFLGLIKAGFHFINEASTDAFRLARSPKEGVKFVYGISLYRNVSYLIANSGVSALLGFIFWVLAARFYTPSDVGLGSALISAATLLSSIGTLGLGFGIIRFLPSSNDKAGLLNSSFTISLLASVAVALVFLAELPLWSPKLMFVRENLIFLTAFIAFVAIATLTSILSQTFVGFRRAGFTLAQAIIASLLKLPLVVAFAVAFKVFGIFASWGLAVAVALAASLFLFLPQLLHRYRPLPSFQRQVTNEMVHFSLANYIGSALRNAPTWILPLMVLNLISAEANAHFYVTWTMASLLLAIPMNTSLSFFAEGSHEEGKVRGDLRRSLRLIAILLVPAVIIMLLLGDKLLLLFGRGYSEAGTYLLWLLAVAAIPASINFLYLGIVQVEKKLKEIVLVTGAIAFGTLVLSYFLLPHFGLLGAGAGWLVAQTIVASIIAPKVARG